MIFTHWIPTHRDGGDKAIFAEWYKWLPEPHYFKVVTIDETIPYLEDIPESAKIVVRNHPMSELFGNRGFRSITYGDSTQGMYESYFAVWDHWVKRNGKKRANPFPVGTTRGVDRIERIRQIAREHVAICERTARWAEARGVSRARLIFALLNEPRFWSDESYADVNIYTCEVFDVGIPLGLLFMDGEAGVGWPGNGGIDQPAQWQWAAPMTAKHRPGDLMGLHEYWALNGPKDNWGWWGGRYKQNPYNVKLFISECGIDTGVVGLWGGGWRDLPGGSEEERADRYVDELLWYADECRRDGRIVGTTPFTYDIGSRDWQRFNTKSEPFIKTLIRKLREHVWPAASSAPVEPTPTVLDGLKEALLYTAAQVQTVHLNPQAGLQREIKGHGYWATSDEVEMDYGGKKYVCQRAEHPVTGEVRVYYCPKPAYTPIQFYVR